MRLKFFVLFYRILEHGGNYFTGLELQSKLRKFLCIFFQQRFCVFLQLALQFLGCYEVDYLWEGSCGVATASIIKFSYVCK